MVAVLALWVCGGHLSREGRSRLVLVMVLTDDGHICPCCRCCLCSFISRALSLDSCADSLCLLLWECFDCSFALELYHGTVLVLSCALAFASLVLPGASLRRFLADANRFVRHIGLTLPCSVCHSIFALLGERSSKLAATSPHDVESVL